MICQECAKRIAALERTAARALAERIATEDLLADVVRRARAAGVEPFAALGRLDRLDRGKDGR